MKNLYNFLLASVVIALLACNTKAKKTTHIEDSESLEYAEELLTETDEVEYLESAMNALEEGDSKLAAQKIMDAVDHIKGYIGEMDDPSEANSAITALIDLATKIRGGDKMTADELEEALLELPFFSQDDLEFEDEELEYGNADKEGES